MQCLETSKNCIEYPLRKGIPIDRIDTNSLRSRGANALSLVGFSDLEIQKMECWRIATFKEYIREELNIFSLGMSTAMKRHFNFVNIVGGVYHDVTQQLIETPYNTSETEQTPPRSAFNNNYYWQSHKPTAQWTPTASNSNLRSPSSTSPN